MEQQHEVLTQVFLLAVVFQVKHFLADFPLQNRYMLQKNAAGWDFLTPLVVHCSIHMVMTLAIVFWIRPELWWLALVDFSTHFVMDRIKSGPRYLGRYSNLKTGAFWYSLGFDQMVHHITHLWIVWKLLVG